MAHGAGFKASGSLVIIPLLKLTLWEQDCHGVLGERGKRGAVAPANRTGF